MPDFDQPAYPTTPGHYDATSQHGNGLSKLQRVASEQLAALIVASATEDGCPPLEDCDMTQDDNGYWCKRNGYWGKHSSTDLPKDRYTIAVSMELRLARHAVKYAKALLEITQ